MYKKIVIGIDQSYTRTGISVAADGKLIKVSSIDFKGATMKSEKRNKLRMVLHRLIPSCLSKAASVTIICERIRTFSHGAKDANTFLNISYIKVTGALIATIVDVASEYGLKVHSADTRSWKSRIVGTSKGSENRNIPKSQANKWPTIKYVIGLGFRDAIESVNRKGAIVYNDDAADSACIALYGFLKNSEVSLKVEE